MTKSDLLKNFSVIACTLIAGAVAFRIGYQLVIKNKSKDREPAAIQRIHDYSHLTGDALLLASKDRLLNSARVVSTGDSSGVELGYFVSKNINGQTVGACEIYDELVLTFVADGMAVSGDQPEMIVTGPCVPEQDLNKITPLMIPHAFIKEKDVEDQVISGLPGQAIKIELHNISDTWPPMWILKSLTLRSDKGKAEFKNDSANIVLNW